MHPLLDPVLILLLLAFVAPVGYVIGEVRNMRWLRVASAIATIATCTFTVYGWAQIRCGFDVCLPVSEAAREYVRAANVQLSNGNGSFVQSEFERFDDYFHPGGMYEPPTVIRGLRNATTAMHHGPH